ncbi:reverse transcriptase/maturase family protein [Cupriavidus sp. JZ107]
MTAAKHFVDAFRASNLTTVFDNKIRDSGTIGIDRITPYLFQKNLKQELSLIRKRVISGTYKFTAYKQKLISKGAESPPRVLSIPTVRDRVTLRALAEMLAKVFPDAVPEIPQTKIDRLSGALQSGVYSEFVKIDLHRFYPSIPHDKLRLALRSRIRKQQILSLIEKAISTPTVSEKKGGKGARSNSSGVPQGLAISNILAEILLLGFDKWMAAMPNVLYERYIDDILILCAPGQACILLKKVCNELEKIGLQPHPPGVDGSKTRCGNLIEEFDFLGYCCKNLRLGIRKQSVHKFESSLAGICTAYRHKIVTAKSAPEAKRALDLCEWRLNLRMTGCIFENKRLGWVFYFSQITDTSQLRAVDKTVQQLMERFSLTSRIKVKRALKTFYESQRSVKEQHRYIPNFDSMPTAEKRRVLALLSNRDISRLSDTRVDELFKMHISKAVRELEQDLADLS